ncbi:MAG: redoxin domain-containing protein [Bacteroidota bacterium]|nr:redoxin domain-containing protein [Bacteroidota bacterium]
MNQKLSFAVLLSLLVSVTCMAQPSGRLKPGTTAPEVIAEDIYGRKINITEIVGSKKVLLSFQRYASCPICNYRIRELKNQYQALTLSNVEIVLFIESSKKNILDNLMGEKMPFYIIADPENIFYNKYRVEKSTMKSLENYLFNAQTKRLIKEGEKYVNPKVPRDASLRRLEAEFLVGNTMKILKAHYGSYIGDFLEISSIKSITVTD